MNNQVWIHHTLCRPNSINLTEMNEVHVKLERIIEYLCFYLTE